MSCSISKPLILIALLAVLPALHSCGGGGGGGGGGTAGTTSDLPNVSVAGQGSVAVFVTDAPADPDLFSAIDARLSRVELIPENGLAAVVLRDGAPVTVNLMNLERDAIPLSYGEGVPEGRYCSIRLKVESVELKLVGGGNVYPQLPAGGVLELILDSCFDMHPDQVVYIQLDLDAGKSIYEENGQYFLRPVFYADIIHGDLKPRLVRLAGDVTESDSLDNRLLLCDAVPVYRRDYRASHDGCAWIAITNDTGYFDNVLYAGIPRPLDELFDSSVLGERITVVGVVDRFGHGYLDLDIPPGHLPPPGECKLWYSDRPPGHQPAPAQCDYLIATAPSGTVVIDHDGRIVVDRRGLVAVDALAVERGNFLQLDGSVSRAVIEDIFFMDVAPGEPVASTLPLPVWLQEAPIGGNGTRLVSKTGELLTAADIDAGEALTGDGVLVTTENFGTYLRSALIVLDDAQTDLERLSGTVMTVGLSSFTVSVGTGEDNTCTGIPGDALVDYGALTNFLTVTLTAIDSTTTRDGTPTTGQTVDVYGQCGVAGSFSAKQVVIDDDDRSSDDRSSDDRSSDDRSNDDRSNDDRSNDDRSNDDRSNDDRGKDDRDKDDRDKDDRIDD